MPEPPLPQEPYVFLSYTSPDRPQVLALADALETAGIRTWVDKRSLIGGRSWDATIADAIRRCTVFALLCSPAAMASPDVLQEVRLAHQYRKPILPLLLEPVRYPPALDYLLAGTHWIELLDRTEAAWLPDVLRALAPFNVGTNQPRAESTTAVPPVASPATNLPAALTSFVGREQELVELERQLPTQRLVTLTGPGGTGKTRLALAAATRAAAAFPDGTWFVDLSAVTDPAFVLVALAKVFDVRESGERPLADVLAAFLRRKRLLLVLDNFEQVVEAAPVLRDLLAAAPDLHLLVTSRVLLRLRGEQPYPVAPLPLPAASHLFVARTRTVRPDFALTAENTPTIGAICTALDGLPLALELAAARMKLLTPAALLGRLAQRLEVLTTGERGAPERQRTLRGTIEWSWALLEETERVLFSRLGVFAGGFTLEAVAAICSADLTLDVLDGLTSLVEKSLVQQREVAGEVRFSLLATLREFALEQLVASGEAEALGHRHAGYFVAFAEGAGDPVVRQDWAGWQPQLDAEHHNLRAVHARAVARQDTDAALRLVGALYFWLSCGAGEHLAGGRAWAEEALALPGAEAPTPGRAAALRTLGLLLFFSADYRGSIAALQEAAALFRALERRGDLSIALTFLAANYPPTSRTAAGLLEEALALADEAGDLFARALALGIQAIHAWQRGELARARAGNEAALAIAQRLNIPFILNEASRNLAMVATDQEDPEAGSFVARALATARAEGGARYNLAETLVLAGLHAQLAGDPEEAVAAATEGLQLVEESGARIAADIWCLEVLACAWSVQERRLDQAARLLGATAQVYATGFTARLRRLALVVEQTVEGLRRALGEVAFAVAYESGRGLSRDEAIELGLEVVAQLQQQVALDTISDQGR